MTRHFHALLALSALAVTLAAQGQALAGKGFAPGMQRMQPAPARAANDFPNPNPNVLHNVRNNLLGNGTGATPKLGMNLGGPKPGGHAIAGHIQGGGIQKQVHVGGGIQQRQGKADCRHVIDMLVRHCLGNQTYDPCIKRYCPDPRQLHGGFFPAHFVGPPIGFGLPVPGDLELVSVGMLSDATPEQGPVYQVTLKNVGSIDAEHFRVSLVAVLGEITEDSPSVTINVDRLAAGQQATLQISLPVAVMALGPQGQQQPAAFETIVVAIDSFDELAESNELNNVATLKRTEVQLIQVETTVTTETAPAAPPAASTPSAPEAVPAPSAEAPPAPESKDIDIDNLQLDNADEAKELFTR